MVLYAEKSESVGKTLRYHMKISTINIKIGIMFILLPNKIFNKNISEVYNKKKYDILRKNHHRFHSCSAA